MPLAPESDFAPELRRHSARSTRARLTSLRLLFRFRSERPGGSVVTGWGTVNDRKHAVKN